MARDTHHHGCPRICWTDVFPDVRVPQNCIPRLKVAIADACKQFNDTAHKPDIQTEAVMAARKCYCGLPIT